MVKIVLSKEKDERYEKKHIFLCQMKTGNYLKSLSKKRTIQAQVVDRARILFI